MILQEVKWKREMKFERLVEVGTREESQEVDFVQFARSSFYPFDLFLV